MDELKIHESHDCSEIAEWLMDAADGKGFFIKITRPKGKFLKLLEYGRIDDGMYYHYVYSDGRYVYDPRLSKAAVPLGDWERLMRGLNRGARFTRVLEAD